MNTGPRRQPQLLGSLITIIGFFLLAATPPRAETVTVFGTERLTRTTGAPNVFNFTFAAGATTNPYQLILDNHGVTSAVVTLNGAQILGPSDFKANAKTDPDGTTVMARPATLRPVGNSLRVELRSKPGSYLSIRISGVVTDTTPPTITATASPAPNAAGWNQTDVQVAFSCSDSESGIASCPAPRLVVTDGEGQIITGTATNGAGTTSTATVTLNIDKTSPTIAGSVTPAANAAGWHNAPVGVTFTCADGGSGIASCPTPVTVSGEGAVQPIVGVARDRAGNAATATVQVSIDTTAPIVRPVITPASSAGWHAGDVTVSFVCEDTGSGVIECPAARVLAAEGADQTVTATVLDRAGNTGTTSTSISIDRTVPTIQATLSPSANEAGWHHTPATIIFTCSDVLSGVAECPAPMTVTSEGANQTITRSVTDRAGHTATASVTVSLDITPPAIRAIPSSTGIANGAITVTFECEDAGSGVAICPAPIVVSNEGLDQPVEAIAHDRAGNTAKAVTSISIDATAPTVVATLAPAATAAGWHNLPVTVSFTCADNGAGVAFCPPEVVLSSEGANQIASGTTRDAAGNTATASIMVSVDLTPPVVQAISSAADWTNQDVSVQFTCEDALSGIADCAAQVTVSTEGEREIPGSATDKAGNVAHASATVKVDRTPPAIEATLDRAPNAAGWHTAPITATFICRDDLSGAIDCPAPATIATEGADQTTTRVVTDRAGNTASADVTVSLDTTPPVIQTALNPPGAWSNTDVQVTFACSDAISGVATCTTPATISNDGAGQEVHGRATDRAGNEAAATATISIDRVPPTIAASVSPPPNAGGWHRTDPTVSFACTDAASGVAECTEGSILSAEGRNRAVTGTVRDAAGNSASASITVSLDRTAPNVTVTAPANGALVTSSPAVVAGGFADALSGTTSITCNGATAGLTGALFSCEAVLSTDAENITVVATDAAGNTGTSIVAVNFDVNNAPVAQAGGPYNGETQAMIAFSGAASSDADGQTLTYAWEFGDGATAVGATPSHAYVNAGSYVVRLTVRDPDGATHTATTAAAIALANRAPAANAGGPYSADINVPVAFNASASTDPDSDVLTYTWNFGDGGIGTGQSPRRSYLSTGTFTASVTVTDGRGGTHVAQAQVTIGSANQNPIADVGGPYSGTATQSISFSGAGSRDPDNDPLTYAWTFGEGGSGSGRDAAHTYSSAGTYNVSVTVTDTRGGSHSAGTTITITSANATPTARAGGPYSGRTGRTIAFDGGQSSDPDNDALTYAWSFGDGRSRTGAQADHRYDSAGTYTVTLTVDDGRGGVSGSAASVAVTEVTAEDNQAPIANAGGPYGGEMGIPVTFTGAASVDPDGDVLEYAWSFGDGGTATGPAPVHTFATAKTYSVSLTVADGRGGSHVSVAIAVMALQADRAPPAVQLSGPTQVLPGAQAIVTATANDNVGVASVTFDVQGGQSSTTGTPPYQRTIAVPAVAAPGDAILVKATAKDAAGNSGVATLSLTITAQPDGTAPVVTVSVPTETAPGATLRVAAGATDASGIASLTFRINGQTVPGGPAPYSAAYQVPQNAAAGSSLLVVAEATDFAGNHATAQATVSVAAAGDVTPPAVSVIAPPTSRAGAEITLVAQAADEGGLAGVTIVVNGVGVASFAAPPYQTAFHVPDMSVAGMRLQVEARAVDFAGLESSATASIQIVGEGAADGVVTGEVYGDTTGLPIASASATLVGDTGAAATTTTDPRGRFVLRGAPADAIVRITKPGYTAVDRPASFQSGRALELFDARLTPLATSTRSISPVLGGSLESNGIYVAVPAGAVLSGVSLTLTRIGGQGLQGLLPAGWSPVASFDIAPAGVTFAAPATASAPRNAVAAGTPLVLATWDGQRSGWRAVGNTIAGPGAELLQALIDASGQYAWLKADAAPAMPTAPVPGDLVAGVSLPQVPDGVQGTVNPQPKLIFYQPGVHSDVVGTITLPTAIASGTRIWSRLTESYTFYSKAEIHPEPFVQDLVFYQKPDDDRTVMAAYPVTPSLVFEALTLERGVIAAELVAPPEGAPDVSFIDAAGGQATLATGERLDVAAGLTTTPIAARISALASTDIGAPIPAGLDLVGAVSVSLAGGMLSGSAVVSIPRPDGLADTAQILLARSDTVQGQTKLVLVGLGRVDADRVVSIAELPKNHTALEGIRAGGRYVFVRPASPVGFIAGQVLGPQGGAFAGAQVSTDALAIVSLSRAPGGYVAAATIGAVKLAALDLQKADTGFAQAALAAAGDEIAMDLRLVSQPPRVGSVSPAHGARNVAVSDPIVIVFSEPVDPASLAGHVRLAKDDVVTDMTSGLTANNTTLTLRPAQPLAADASYTLTIEKVKDGSGYELAAAVVTQFFTVDTTAPPPPAAGSLSASLPENGTTEVRATQGTAGAHDRVTVENLTRGTSTPVLLDPNGGFLVVVQASATDVLEVKIVDQSGNEAVVSVPRFTRANADGSVTASVTADGGRIEGPGGIALDVARGTFPAGALVTLKPVAELDLPVQLTPDQKEFFSFSGGIELDFGGAEPQQYVDVSVPAKPGDTVANQWLVAQVVTINGVDTFNMVDMAALENGRITTASPPCPGVTGAGVYGIYKSKRDVGVNYGQVYNTTVNGGFQIDVEAMYSAEVFGGGFVMPFPVMVMTQRQSVCMPVLSGNVSISENQIEIEIDPALVTPADRSIVVVNNAVSPSAKYSFPRNILEYAFRVPGREDDPIDVIVEKTDGSQVTLTSQQIVSIQKDAGASTVTIRLNMDKLKVTAKKFIIRNKAQNPATETVFEQTVSPITLRVAGAPGDAVVVSTIDASGAGRPIAFTVAGSTYPTGNLALRAVSGTIDPTRAQIVAHNALPACGAGVQPPCRDTPVLDPNRGVNELFLSDESSAPTTGTVCRFTVCLPIDLATVEHGAVVFPFQGDRTHRYALHVIYEDLTPNPNQPDDDRPRDYVSIPGYRLIITSTQTGRVIRSISAQAPPRGAPANLGLITDDDVRPLLTGGPARFDAFDPSQPLKFTFSEAIDELNAMKLVLLNGAGQQLAIANVILSPDGRTVTFVPKSSLRLGETYTLDFKDVTDVARNKVLGQAITLKTFAPLQLCASGGACPATDSGTMHFTMVRGADTRVPPYTLELEPIADLDFLRETDSQGRLHTNLFLTLGGYGQIDHRMSTVDVTDPGNPSELSRGFGGRGKRRITLMPGLQNFRVAPQYVAGMAMSPYTVEPDGANNPCPVPNLLFNGDMAVISSFSPEISFLTFYNVTAPHVSAPCTLGDKLLTVSPANVTDFNRRGTVHASGYARGIAAIKHDAGISLFTAVGEVGVTVTDLAENIPARYPHTRLKDNLYSGDVVDIEAFRDKLLVARRDGPLFEILDVNLTPIASIALPQRPVRLVTAEAFQFDANGDGQITQDEVKDFAFLATDSCNGATCSGQLQVIDLTNLTSPSIIGTYKLPGAVFSLDLDADRQRLVVAGAQLGAGYALYMIDLSKPDEIAPPDIDNDGWDDRIVWRHDYQNARPNAVRIDKDRGLAYVGMAYSTTTGQERGALDIWALFDNCCDLSLDFTAEPAIDGTEATGEARALLKREQVALREGIRQGLAKAATDFGAVNGLVIMEQGSGACIWRGDGECDSTYQPGVSDHDFEVFFPNLAPDDPADLPLVVNCTIQTLNRIFADRNGISVPGQLPFHFLDVTFYPMSLAELQRARLNVDPPKPLKAQQCGAEPAEGSDPSGDLGMGRQQLLLKWLVEGEYVELPGVAAGPDFDALLMRLRDADSVDSPTGVPLLEGFEWSRLMEYMLTKSKAYIRIEGAADTTSAFHELYMKQLHDAGKYAVRAALARMVADRDANEIVVAGRGSARVGSLRRHYNSTVGCRDLSNPGVQPGQAPLTRCTSFEQYVASAAVDTSVFTPDELRLIATAYRVKSDLETISTEKDADAFIAAVARFVSVASDRTVAAYTSGVVRDPSHAARVRNMTALAGGIDRLSLGGKMKDALTKAKLQIAPRVLNNGFRNADGVDLVMYRGVTGPGAGTAVTSMPITIAGGESRRIFARPNAPPALRSITVADRSFTDEEPLTYPARKEAFLLGGGEPGNPALDLLQPSVRREPIVFTIDLPGHKVKEADRDNNYAGFHYYVLNRETGVAPAKAGRPPLPVSTPGVLSPDATCVDTPKLTILSQSLLYQDPPVIQVSVVNTSAETLTSVQICSVLANACVTIASLAAGEFRNVKIPFAGAATAGTLDSTISATALDANQVSVPIDFAGLLVNSGQPFDVHLFDATPLNDQAHPFSRSLAHQDASGAELPVRGVTTDGTSRALRIEIGRCPAQVIGGQVVFPSCKSLLAGQPVIVRIADGRPGALATGIGELELGAQKGLEITAQASSSGKLELFYTPPNAFIRVDHNEHDFNAVERIVRLSVTQAAPGTAVAEIVLRRPPVFLIGGLFGTVADWAAYQPLVPKGHVPTSFIPFAGFDKRFDVFTIGVPFARGRFQDLAKQTRDQFAVSLATSLRDMAIGKFDVLGHSMGGVLTRLLVTGAPNQAPDADTLKVRASVRKLIALNSPFRGSPLANEVVRIREQSVVPFMDTVKDFLNPEDVNPDVVAARRGVLCTLMLQGAGNPLSGYSIFDGAMDDLQTRLVYPDGRLTELGWALNAGVLVPTHVLTDNTTESHQIGSGAVVKGLWALLAGACSLTPEESSKEASRLAKVSFDALLMAAGRGGSLAAKGGATAFTIKPPALGFGHALSAFSIYSKTKSLVADGMRAVFQSPNDRIVTLNSQFGGIPPNTATVQARTEVSGDTDHLVSKDTENIASQACIGRGANGLWTFLKTAPGASGKWPDINGDGWPDNSCRTVMLLEAPPQPPFFYTGPSDGQDAEFSVERIVARPSKTIDPRGVAPIPVRPDDTFFSISSERSMTSNQPLALPQGLRPLKLTCEVAPNTDVTRIRWRIERNADDTWAVDPTSHFQANGLQAQFAMNEIAGSFHITCYGDLNRDGILDAEEPRRVLNLAVVQVRVMTQGFTASTGTFAPRLDTNRGSDDMATIQTGLNEVSDQAAFSMDGYVQLTGGGADNSIGVDKISVLIVQNITGDELATVYDNGTSMHEVFWRTPGTRCFGTPEPPATLLPFPVLDGGTPWPAGGSEPSNGAHFRETLENGGLRRRIVWYDSPNFNVFKRHHCPPAGVLLRSSQGHMTFSNHILTFSSQAPLAYAAHAKVGWTITLPGTFTLDENMVASWLWSGLAFSGPLNAFDPSIDANDAGVIVYGPIIGFGGARVSQDGRLPR